MDTFELDSYINVRKGLFKFERFDYKQRFNFYDNYFEMINYISYKKEPVKYSVKIKYKDVEELVWIVSEHLLVINTGDFECYTVDEKARDDAECDAAWALEMIFCDREEFDKFVEIYRYYNPEIKVEILEKD